MPVTVSKDGSTWKEIVYRIHAIDEWGDLTDLGEHDDRDTAIARAQDLSSQYPRLEVEKATIWHPGRRHEPTFKVIWESSHGEQD